MRPVSRRRSRQRGYEILEFGLVAIMLVPAFLWVFINGMNMIRMIQCTQICRDIGNLYMEGVDFTTYQAQTLAQTLAQGYGLQIGSSYSGNNPTNDSNSGNGLIILSEVMYVGTSACSGAADEHHLHQFREVRLCHAPGFWKQGAANQWDHGRQLHRNSELGDD